MQEAPSATTAYPTPQNYIGMSAPADSGREPNARSGCTPQETANGASPSPGVAPKAATTTTKRLRRTTARERRASTVYLAFRWTGVALAGREEATQ